MSGPITIEDEKTAEKRSADILVYEFDYDARSLATGVELASVGTFTIDPADGRLTSDNPTLLTGNRKVSVRLSGGKPGKTYLVTHSAATNETPAQTLNKCFALFVKPSPR
jgi:hypothetical protein